MAGRESGKSVDKKIGKIGSVFYMKVVFSGYSVPMMTVKN